MKLLILNGSSCSGKSTVVKQLMKQKENLFYLSYDALKWSFANYTSARYYQEVWQIVLAVAKTVVKMKHDIVCDAGLYRASRQELINLALQAGYEVIEINLETSHETLRQRFDERITSALATPGSRISNISSERFEELLNIFEREKDPNAITLRTDTQSVEDVAKDVLKLF